MISVQGCWLLVLVGVMMTSAQGPPPKAAADDGDFSNVNADGSFDFGYNNKDRGASYHLAQANRANVVQGRFGSRDPKDNIIKETVYTAGPRGFRARGPHIHRKMDLDQRPRGPIGNKDDPYFDPNEDPSYSFGFKTNTYEKQEDANRRGDVTGRYSYVDDVGERHNVEYIAGKDTGFHVKTAFPDSNPGSIGPLFYNGPLVRGEKKQRGHTSVQRGLDGSYRFISAGPDQRRTESSDASGNVRGSYSYLDDKNVQRTVHYIAGPGIGYRVIKNSKDPFIPSFFPVLPDYRDPTLNKPFSAVDFAPGNSFTSDKDDDIFGRPEGSAASGHVKPPKNNRKPIPPPATGGDDGNDLFDKNNGPTGSQEKPGSGSDSTKPGSRPTSGSGPGDSSFDGPNGGNLGSDDGDDDDFFGKPSSKPIDNKPSGGSNEIGKPDLTGNDDTKPDSGEDDIFGEAKPSGPKGGSRPTSRPGSGNRPSHGGSRPGSGGRPNNRPGGSSETNGSPEGPSGRPGARPGGRPPGRPGGKPGGRPGGRPGGDRPNNRPGRPSGRPDGRPSSEDQDGPKPGIDDEDDDIFGVSKPSGPSSGGDKINGKPGVISRPSNNKIDKDDKVRPGTGEGGVLFVNVDDDDDIFGASQSGGNKPGKEDGSKPGSSRPGSGAERPYGPDSGADTGPSAPESPTSGSAKPIGPPLTGGFLDGGSREDGDKKGGNKDKHDGIYSHPGGDTEITFGGHGDKNLGGTIFTNLGDESIHFPPGKSVRAHVQSIDIFPYGTKVPSPGEAIDEELKKHGSR